MEFSLQMMLPTRRASGDSGIGSWIYAQVSANEYLSAGQLVEGRSEQLQAQVRGHSGPDIEHNVAPVVQ